MELDNKIDKVFCISDALTQYLFTLTNYRTTLIKKKTCQTPQPAFYSYIYVKLHCFQSFVNSKPDELGIYRSEWGVELWIR